MRRRRRHGRSGSGGGGSLGCWSQKDRRESREIGRSEDKRVKMCGEESPSPHDTFFCFLRNVMFTIDSAFEFGDRKSVV